MDTIKLVVVAFAALLASACSGPKVGFRHDTYLSAKEREKLNQSQRQKKAFGEADSREDNFSRSSREYDDDYCYSCRVRRYSTGVWYDPWWSPGWIPTWGWRSWCSSGWCWDLAYAGSGWYYTPGWGLTYYAGPDWWVVSSGTSYSYSPRYNYRPRTYTTPRGNTTYTPPRSTVITPEGMPPRRSDVPASTSPSRPSYTLTSPHPAGSTRPSIQSGRTGTGYIRSSSPTGSNRPW